MANRQRINLTYPPSMTRANPLTSTKWDDQGHPRPHRARPSEWPCARQWPASNPPTPAVAGPLSVVNVLKHIFEHLMATPDSPLL